MTNETRLIDKVVLNSTVFPRIDLHNKDVVSAQFENLRKFKNRQFRVFLMIALLISSFLTFNILGEYLAVDTGTTEFGAIAFAVISLCIVFLLLFMFKYQCPHCGTVPAGVAVGVGSEVTYSRGIHPFPKRCGCCGYYLSKHALRQDLLELTIAAANTGVGTPS
jgi:hypothetical protein